MPRPKQNLYGQEIGSKGFLTREKIVNATAELLTRRPLREIRVAEIGQSAGLSAATFYLYFKTVSDAGLAAAERVEQSTSEILRLLEAEWSHRDLPERSRAFVNAYFAVWDKHEAVLRVRNFVADEGDRRFSEVRRRAIEPIHLLLQKKVAQHQSDLPEYRRLDPPSSASVILALLERTAQIIRMPSAHRATRPRQVDTAVFMVASAICGRDPYVENGRNAKS